MRALIFFTRRIYASSIYTLYPVYLFIYQSSFIYSFDPSCLLFHISTKLHSFIHCILLFFVYINHEALSLPYLFFSLTFIKTGKQLNVQEIQADGYKKPCWPIQLLFSLVQRALMYIFISLYFSQELMERYCQTNNAIQISVKDPRLPR